MANGFAALMPFLQASGLVGLPPEAVGEDINVLRRQDAAPQAQAPTLSAPPIDPDVAPISLGNRSFIEERDDAYAKQPQRKGLFGVKGTLRDVLGALGDNYLIQNGQKPRYQAMREQERLQDAMAGFTQQDPRAAIERAAGINPEFARDLFQLVGQQQAKAQDQQISAYEAQGTAQKDSTKRLTDARNYAARVIRQADTPEKFQYAMDVIRRTTGMDPEDLGLLEAMTPEQRAVYAAGDMTVAQQENTDITRQRMAQQADQFTRAEQGRMARDNPPVERQPTRQEQAEGLYRRAIGGDKEAQALFDRLYPAPKKSRRPLPSGFSGGGTGSGKMVIRNGKLVPR